MFKNIIIIIFLAKISTIKLYLSTGCVCVLVVYNLDKSNKDNHSWLFLNYQNHANNKCFFFYRRFYSMAVFVFLKCNYKTEN